MVTDCLIKVKARLLSLLHRPTETTPDTPRDPAVRARLLELDRAGYSVDYLIAAAAKMRTGRTVGTSR